jgi:hypothetical protein
MPAVVEEQRLITLAEEQRLFELIRASVAAGRHERVRRSLAYVAIGFVILLAGIAIGALA